jgi:uncharacterized membrane protein YgcG
MRMLRKMIAVLKSKIKRRRQERLWRRVLESVGPKPFSKPSVDYDTPTYLRQGRPAVELARQQEDDSSLPYLTGALIASAMANDPPLSSESEGPSFVGGGGDSGGGGASSSWDDSSSSDSGSSDSGSSDSGSSGGGDS